MIKKEILEKEETHTAIALLVDVTKIEIKKSETRLKTINKTISEGEEALKSVTDGVMKIKKSYEADKKHFEKELKKLDSKFLTVNMEVENKKNERSLLTEQNKNIKSETEQLETDYEKKVSDITQETDFAERTLEGLKKEIKKVTPDLKAKKIKLGEAEEKYKDMSIEKSAVEAKLVVLKGEHEKLETNIATKKEEGLKEITKARADIEESKTVFAETERQFGKRVKRIKEEVTKLKASNQLSKNFKI